MHQFNGRLKKIEGTMEPTPKNHTLLVFYLPDEQPEAALVRYGIDPDAWYRIQYRRWIFADRQPCPRPVVLGLPCPANYAELLQKKLSEMEEARRRGTVSNKGGT